MRRMSATTRLSLLDRVRDGHDQDAWSEFFAVYKPLLIGYVRSRCRGRDDQAVDEIVQTVFIKLHGVMRTFSLDQERGRFRTYLFRVTQNTLTDYQRKGARRKDREPLAGPEPVEPPSGGQDELDQEIQRVIFARVTAQVRAEVEPKNPNKWRSFELHGMNGRPAKEVADELGIKTDLVYQNSKRVLETIVARCQEQFAKYLADGH
jgi:RNA polymerase sigma-70 factor (ECF subfamily)